ALQWSGYDPDPVLFALDNQHATMVGRAHWMLRLVDLAAALAGRPYPAEVGFAVQDAVCPWSAGGWRLAVDGGKAEVTRVGAVPAGAPTRGCWAASTPVSSTSCGPPSPPKAVDHRALLGARRRRGWPVV